MNLVYLLIGGNLGNRVDLLNQVKVLISKYVGVINAVSSVYETSPWGFSAEQDFLNQVLVVATGLDVQSLLNANQKIENDLGRKRNGEQYISRTMDIDILYFNDQIVMLPNLQVPHTKMHERKFTMIPLVEIAPDFIHPVFNKTNLQLLTECEDISVVRKLD